jgi:hypothetical protein
MATLSSVSNSSYSFVSFDPSLIFQNEAPDPLPPDAHPAEQERPRVTVINGKLIGGEGLTCGQRLRALREHYTVSRRVAELAAKEFGITDYTVLY